MQDGGIFPGDVVIVQKQVMARKGQIVIALVNGEATIKTYHRKAGTVELHSANETMQPILVEPTDSFQIEGIVVGVIHHLREDSFLGSCCPSLHDSSLFYSPC